MFAIALKKSGADQHPIRRTSPAAKKSLTSHKISAQQQQQQQQPHRHGRVPRHGGGVGGGGRGRSRDVHMRRASTTKNPAVEDEEDEEEDPAVGVSGEFTTTSGEFQVSVDSSSNINNSTIKGNASIANASSSSHVRNRQEGPLTYVRLYEGGAPIRTNAGFVSAEIEDARGEPVLIQFQAPWPLLPTTYGLEARDLRKPEQAFVVVLMNQVSPKMGSKAVTRAILDAVMGPRGKFATFGKPTHVKCKRVDEELLLADFTNFASDQRPVTRKAFFKLQWALEDTLVVLVTGTTTQRYRSQEKTLMMVANSFVAFAAPSADD